MNPSGDLELPSLLFLGAGGVGGNFGGRVAAAGGRVTFVARGEHGRAIRERGLLILTDEGEIAARPDVILPGEPVPPGAGAVVLAVKHRDLAAGLARIAPAVGPGTPVLSLLNGLGHEDAIRRALPQARPLVGMAFVGASIEEPGVIRYTSEGRIVFGEAPAPGGGAPPPLSDAARALAAALSVGGFPVKAVDDVRPYLWRKLLWNVAFNSVNTVLGGTCADLMKTPEVRALLRGLMEEVALAARTLKFDIPEAWVEKTVSAEVNFTPYVTSMRLDYERGRAMEIEPILTRPCETAEAHGVAMPRTRTMEALLRGLERAAGL